MNETTRMVEEAAERLLREHCTKELVDAAEAGTFPEALWRQLEEMGLPLAAAPEAAGGTALPLADALGLLRLAGAHALPLPLADSLLANAWLGAAGLPLPGGPLAVALPGSGDTLRAERQGDALVLSGTVRGVSFAPWARTVVLACESTPGEAVLALAAPEELLLDAGRNLAGEPTAAVGCTRLAIDAGRWTAAGCGLGTLRAQLALSRAVLISGAMQSILDLSTSYALERRQFGRPIAAFQAVQQQLAVLAGEAAAALRAADGALEALAAGDADDEIAVAKARAGEAAGRGAEIAHQVHGAMGFTHEHRLHHRTRRLWAWRDEHGHEAEWQARLGRRICAAGPDALWAVLTHSA
ncbi:MAG: acyl-CoA dehydrogenase family protein [Pseudomonadales bacterium]|jgi:alkylation response protein AidB-like acyl-CoA dehydrogenase|nr:acyl-CoA dehydrogenase family protein [Pseudomonadales bacterium]